MLDFVSNIDWGSSFIAFALKTAVTAIAVPFAISTFNNLRWAATRQRISLHAFDYVVALRRDYRSSIRDIDIILTKEPAVQAQLASAYVRKLDGALSDKRGEFIDVMQLHSPAFTPDITRRVSELLMAVDEELFSARCYLGLYPGSPIQDPSPSAIDDLLAALAKATGLKVENSATSIKARTSRRWLGSKLKFNGANEVEKGFNVFSLHPQQTRIVDALYHSLDAPAPKKERTRARKAR
jgi:hypothetical protein